MGLFDHVNFEMPCPRCGAICRNWQSKDGDCLLKRVEIEDVYNMHALCDCGQWIEMTRTPPPPAPAKRSAPATLADAQAIGFRWLGEPTHRDNTGNNPRA